jgi:hypothetical protein
VLDLIREEQEAAASAAWKTLSPAQQQRLAWEVASTRADELRRAFPSLVAIGAGFRVRNESAVTPRKRGRRAVPELTGEPSVVFTVARKWKSQRRRPVRGRPRAGELPRSLLAYADAPASADGRVLVAVPTDVRDRRTGRARPLQGGRGTIAARSSGLRGQLGILTCAVNLPGRPGLFAMGAHHVLAMSLAASQAGVPVDHASIVLRSTNTVIGSLVDSPIGSLLPGQIGFDAALAEIIDPSDIGILRVATGGMLADDIWGDPGAFPLTCHVLVGPPDNVLPARFVQRRVVFGDEWGEIVYFGGSVAEPVHPVMLELWIDETAPRSTERGESGCPVVTDDGRRLVGMHIGGARPPSRAIWVIPATELFLASRWQLSAPPTLFPL